MRQPVSVLGMHLAGAAHVRAWPGFERLARPCPCMGRRHAGLSGRAGVCVHDAGCRAGSRQASTGSRAQVREVWDTFLVCARLGTQCVEAYVISMAGAASDVLAVELLKREACRKVSSGCMRGWLSRNEGAQVGWNSCPDPALGASNAGVVSDVLAVELLERAACRRVCPPARAGLCNASERPAAGQQPDQIAAPAVASPGARHASCQGKPSRLSVHAGGRRAGQGGVQPGPGRARRAAAGDAARPGRCGSCGRLPALCGLVPLIPQVGHPFVAACPSASGLRGVHAIRLRTGIQTATRLSWWPWTLVGAWWQLS